MASVCAVDALLAPLGLLVAGVHNQAQLDRTAGRAAEAAGWEVAELVTLDDGRSLADIISEGPLPIASDAKSSVSRARISLIIGV